MKNLCLLFIVILNLTAWAASQEKALHNFGEGQDGANSVLRVLTAAAEVPARIQRNSTQARLGNHKQSSLNPSLFLPPVSYSTGGSYPGSVAIADLNGDGKLDSVVANAGSGTVAVLLGDGRGGFAAPITYSPNIKMPWSVAVADLNSDRVPDLVLAGTAANGCGISVLLGNGDGTFQLPKQFLCASGTLEVYSVAVADLNGDGKLDLAVSTYRNITVLLGNGDGTFQPPVVYSWGNGDGTSFGADSLKVADLNGDGRPDLIVASGYQGPSYLGKSTVGVLLGNGDGTFQPAVDYDSGGYYAFSLAVSDLNGDGKPDIVVANNCLGVSSCPQPQTVGVLLGNGDGTFQPAITYAAGLLNPFSVALADVNWDGTLDTIVANACTTSACTSGSVGVLLGNGDGTFQLPVTFATQPWAFMVAMSDVNGDSEPDILAVHYKSSGSMSVLLNNSRATATSLTSSLNPSTIGQPVTFTATVTTSRGTPPNGEIITFYNGSAVMGTAPLNAGAAGLTTSALLPGTFTITASYPGDANFAASTSPGLRQVVNPAAKSPTTTTLVSSLNPSIYGQKVIFTATVTTTGSVSPTGTVVFTWSGYTIGSAILNSSGVATLSKSNLNADPYPLTAVYRGDTNNEGSTSPVVNQTVTQTITAATLSSSLNPSSPGQAVTFTANITSPTVTPTGPVTFAAGTTVLGTVQLNHGKASYTTTSLPTGSTVIKVTYNGNSNIKESSATVTQVVRP